MNLHLPDAFLCNNLERTIERTMKINMFRFPLITQKPLCRTLVAVEGLYCTSVPSPLVFSFCANK